MQRQWTQTETWDVSFNIWKQFFPMRVVKHWGSLPREVVEASTWLMLKTPQDTTHENLVWPCSEQRAGLVMDLRMCFPTSALLWSYEILWVVSNPSFAGLVTKHIFFIDDMGYQRAFSDETVIFFPSVELPYNPGYTRRNYRLFYNKFHIFIFILFFSLTE